MWRAEMTGNGARLVSGGAAVNLDPRSAAPGAVNFVSHAHADHLPAAAGGRVLASGETARIAASRGADMRGAATAAGGLEMVDSGHILGSRGLLAGEAFYTGDICTRPRGFLRGADVPRCRTLITECTFGLPEFGFPPAAEAAARANRVISDMYSRGVPVILMGYQLGKAQTLSEMFGHWDPLYYHDSVKAMNDVHRELGVPLRDAPGHTEAESRGLLAGGPWVMVAPMLPARSGFVARMKERYGAVTVGFSGWAASPRFAFGRRCDHSVPLSDHCDFGELLAMVERTGAEEVYTVHGFVDEFAASLRRLGFDARPLRGGRPG